MCEFVGSDDEVGFVFVIGIVEYDNGYVEVYGIEGGGYVCRYVGWVEVGVEGIKNYIVGR